MPDPPTYDDVLALLATQGIQIRNCDQITVRRTEDGRIEVGLRWMFAPAQSSLPERHVDG